MLLNKQKALELILALGEAYGKELTEARARIYLTILWEVLQGRDFDKTLMKIVNSQEYFPSPKQILDLFDPKPTLEQKAEGFIEQMLLGFSAPAQDWAGLGREGYWIATKILGVDRFSLQSGRIKPEFMRKAWKEKLINYWAKGENSSFAKRLGNNSNLKQLDYNLKIGSGNE